MGDLTAHFSRREFACPCCGQAGIRGRLLVTLETIREAVGSAVHIESGFRCPRHNAEVGGKPNSGHVSGEAADIWVDGWDNAKLGALISRLYEAGDLPYLRFCYLIQGTSATRVHVGVDEKPRRRVFGF